MHVIIILVYTVLNVLAYNVLSFSQAVAYMRVSTAWYFFGGLQDIFIAYMMFFILDDEVKVYRDEKNKMTYSMLDVINTEAS